MILTHEHREASGVDPWAHERPGAPPEVINGRTVPTGPLCEQYHPGDDDGNARARFWDTPPRDRRAAFKRLAPSLAPFAAEQAYARAWFSEYCRWCGETTEDRAAFFAAHPEF